MNEWPKGFSIRDDFADLRKAFVQELGNLNGEGVIATALGAKLVVGSLTDEPALQVIVKQKRPISEISRRCQIPSSFGGLTTDVIDQRKALAATPTLLAPTETTYVGYGTALRNSRSLPYTASFGARDSSGFRVLVTAAHKMRDNELISINMGQQRNIGRISERLTSLAGRQVYGRRAKFPKERFSIDTALVRLTRTVRIRRGLPGGHSFSISKNVNQALHNLVGRKVLAFGQGSRGWRFGTVLGTFPRRTKGKITGFCWVDHQPVSRIGDSGSLWLAKTRSGYTAIGTHRGLIGNFAFLNDITAIVTLFGLTDHYGMKK